MDIELAKKLVEILEDRGEEASLYEAYSGRGMYGRTTAGVVCDGLGTLLQVVIEDAPQFVEDDYPMFDNISGFNTDSMGMSTIIY